jgi:N-formylglutamate deformylase
MITHYDLTDIEFENRFNNCTLNPSLFTHEAHLRLAWINIDMYGIDIASINIQKQLEQFVAAVGAQDKYNKTLTLAALKTVNHFKLKSKSKTFKEFINEFPRLKTSFRELITSHYSFDIYNSALTKKEFLQPDLLPYD